MVPFHDYELMIAMSSKLFTRQTKMLNSNVTLIYLAAFFAHANKEVGSTKLVSKYING